MASPHLASSIGRARAILVFIPRRGVRVGGVRDKAR
jgi:hypothetical protein